MAKKKDVFSVTKTVKAAARETVGTPKKSYALPTVKEKAKAKPKHKETFADLLEASDDA